MGSRESLDMYSPPSKGHFKQYLAAILLNCAALSYGSLMGWGSPSQILLQSEDSPVGQISEGEFSWLNSHLFIGGTVGPLFWGRLLGKIGPKKTSAIFGLFLAVSWALLTVPYLEMCYLGRFLGGAGGACFYIVAPSYIAEISSDETRGRLSSFILLFTNAGVLLIYILGGFLSYFWYCMFGMGLSLFFVVAFLFMAESPDYLLKKGRVSEAEKALAWFRGGDEKIVAQEVVRKRRLLTDSGSSKLCDLVKTRGNRRALTIALGLLMGQHCSGAIAMLTYAENIFKDAGTEVEPSLAAIILGAVQLIGSYVLSIIVTRCRRKTLLLSSYSVIIVCLIFMGSYFLFRSLGYDVSLFNTLTIVCLCSHIFMYACGAGPVPFNVITETLAPDIRPLAMSVIVLLATFAAFLSVKLVSILKEAFGFEGCFFFFAGASILVFTFILFVVPETFKRPLEDVLLELNSS